MLLAMLMQSDQIVNQMALAFSVKEGLQLSEVVGRRQRSAAASRAEPPAFASAPALQLRLFRAVFAL